MFLICADILGRTLFNGLIRGVAQIVGNSIVTAVLLVAVPELGLVFLRPT